MSGLTRRSAGAGAERRCRYGAVALLVSLALFASPTCRTSFAQATPPAPTAQQPAQQQQQPSRIQSWLDDLADKESSVRDRARTNLMGLSRVGLGELREAIDRTRPLSPAQAAVLHDIVIHVFISANEPDRVMLPGRSGFLGVLLEPVESASIIDVAPAPQPPQPPDQQQQPPQPDDIQDFGQMRPPGGVLIKETWAGFAGFRFLRVGDVVVATGGEQPTRAPTVQELRAAVQATPPGQTLDLRVLRQGRIVDVPVNVSPRPQWATDETTTRQMQSRRLRRAEMYWQFAFAPLLFKDDGML